MIILFSKEIKPNETTKLFNENGLSLIKPCHSQIEKEYSSGKMLSKSNGFLLTLFSFRYEQKTE
jgi:hypothetical protein